MTNTTKESKGKKPTPRKDKPTDQEFPPKSGIHKQRKPVKKSKVKKSHKAISSDSLRDSTRP